MDNPLTLPNCDWSIFGAISRIMGSDIKDSKIFERFLVPDILRRSSKPLGGKTLGTGVTYSYFQKPGQTPDRIAVLYILQSGAATSAANSERQIDLLFVQLGFDWEPPLVAEQLLYHP